MSGPPAPERRPRQSLHPVLGAATALVMATTGTVIVPPSTSAAQFSPRGVAVSSQYRSGLDTMTYGRTQLSTASRDSDRVSDELRAQTLARRERVEQKRAKRERVEQKCAKRERAEQKRVEQRRAERKRTARLSANRWVLPLANYSLSARFGEVSWLWSSYHTGLDFVAGYGTAIRSVASGTVTEASYDGSYGYKTVVTLENGTELWYCHQTSLAVGVGTAVGPGEVIGYVGTTGNVTGAHLHLEVRPGGGDPVDPFTALTQHGLKP